VLFSSCDYKKNSINELDKNLTKTLQKKEQFTIEKDIFCKVLSAFYKALIKNHKRKSVY